MDRRGHEPARDYFERLDSSDQAKVLALFRRLADHGQIQNREKFKNLGNQGQGLSEFKSFQIRFLGDFRPGKRFLVAHGLRKKKDDLRQADIETTARVLREHDERERRRGGTS